MRLPRCSLDLLTFFGGTIFSVLFFLFSLSLSFGCWPESKCAFSSSLDSPCFSQSWKGIRCNECQLMFVEAVCGSPRLPPAAGVSFSSSQCRPSLSLQESHLRDGFLQSQQRASAQRCTEIYGRRLPPWLCLRVAPPPAHTGSHCFSFSLYCSSELFNAHANKKENKYRFSPAWVLFKHIS